MRRKTGAVCMVLGAALILCALALFMYNRHQAAEAERASAELLTQLAGQESRSENEAVPDPYSTEMDTVEIDGHSYIGRLSIPCLGLELPVMSDWSYPQLRISPCRYSGSAGGRDLVLMAHNYSGHFGQISRLSAGDLVVFQDVNGVATVYEVAALEVLEPTAVSDMTAGDYDLTLFTCTYGGASRVTVRCSKA